MPRNQNIRPPSVPCVAATTMLPLTVARTTVANLRNRCCLCSSLRGIKCLLWRARLPPSRSRKNSKYSMIPMLIRNRSEEHTSELQSLMRISYAVFCLKKKNHNKSETTDNYAHQQTKTSLLKH